MLSSFCAECVQNYMLSSIVYVLGGVFGGPSISPESAQKVDSLQYVCRIRRRLTRGIARLLLGARNAPISVSKAASKDTTSKA